MCEYIHLNVYVLSLQQITLIRGKIQVSFLICKTLIRFPKFPSLNKGIEGLRYTLFWSHILCSVNTAWKYSRDCM